MELKGLDYVYEPVNLLKNEQSSPEHLKRNPQGLVPAFETEEGYILTQSLAIIEYLEERYPETPLLPANGVERARARAIAATIACEAQPFMNLRTVTYLKKDLELGDDALKDWLNRWAGGALASVDALVGDGAGFCVGDHPTMAEAFLIPQIFSAQRFGVDLSRVRRLVDIFDRCNAMAPFIRAHPQNQPDAVAA